MKEDSHGAYKSLVPFPPQKADDFPSHTSKLLLPNTNRREAMGEDDFQKLECSDAVLCAGKMEASMTLPRTRSRTPGLYTVGTLGKACHQVEETHVSIRRAPQAIKHTHRFSTIPVKTGPSWGKQCGPLSVSSFGLLHKITTTHSAMVTSANLTFVERYDKHLHAYLIRSSKPLTKVKAIIMPSLQAED